MHSVLAVSDVEVATLWWISVAVALVVVVVATGLLTNIVVTLRHIDTNVNDIWTAGKRIANNTVQLWLLGRVNSVVGDIRSHAYKVNDVAGTIAAHATTCQHCPACVAPVGSRGQGGAPQAGSGWSPSQAQSWRPAGESGQGMGPAQV